MFVETLHPKNMLKKIFTNQIFHKLEKNSKNKFIKEFNGSNSRRKMNIINFLQNSLKKRKKNINKIKELFKQHNMKTKKYHT